jgi:hypothetical protein
LDKDLLLFLQSLLDKDQDATPTSSHLGVFFFFFFSAPKYDPTNQPPSSSVIPQPSDGKPVGSTPRGSGIDATELPKRYHRKILSAEEIEYIEVVKLFVFFFLIVQNERYDTCIQ